MYEIALHQAADQTYLDVGARLLDVASNAQRIFAAQEAAEKRRILNFVISNDVEERHPHPGVASTV
jgi:site-specific DNA recombinase